MNWFKKISQTENPSEQIARNLPVISSWNGMSLTDIGSSYNSISSSMEDYEVLNGIREIPLSMFENTTPSSKNQAERERVQNLAQQIQENQWIEPLVVAFDDHPSPYIIEGAHRFDALVSVLGAQTLPSLVVIDKSDYGG